MSRALDDRLGTGDAPKARPPLPKLSWIWLPLLPFFIFAVGFLFMPSVGIVLRSFEGASDSIYLRDADGALVDSANAGGEWAAGDRNLSMERLGGRDVPQNWAAFNGTGASGHDRRGDPIGGTPGGLNSNATILDSSARVVINEVLWGGTAASVDDEWVELFNPGTEDIDLSGWTFTDEDDIHLELSGTIPAGQYLLLEAHDDQTVQDIAAGGIFDGEIGNGGFTLDNFKLLLSRRDLTSAYRASISVSLITAVGGGIFGFLLAYAAILGGLPRSVRSFLLTFSGVASNFAGVPLAFAFISTLGRVGLVTEGINGLFHTNLYNAGFSIYNLWGLSLVYMYFQFPLMVLIMAPALDGLRREWREASENLGATGFQYWRSVALPILTPTLLGATILLFGNAFGAYATAYAFAGSRINLVTIVIGSQIQGDVLYNPQLGYALAFGMVVIMGLSMVAYYVLMRRASRWLR